MASSATGGGSGISEMAGNARVASMILAAMTAEQRSDVISHISTSSLKMLYRLHTDYTQSTSPVGAMRP